MLEIILFELEVGLASHNISSTQKDSHKVGTYKSYDRKHHQRTIKKNKYYLKTSLLTPIKKDKERKKGSQLKNSTIRIIFVIFFFLKTHKRFPYCLPSNSKLAFPKCIKVTTICIQSFKRSLKKQATILALTKKEQQSMHDSSSTKELTSRSKTSI